MTTRIKENLNQLLKQAETSLTTMTSPPVGLEETIACFLGHKAFQLTNSYIELYFKFYLANSVEQSCKDFKTSAHSAKYY